MARGRAPSHNAYRGALGQTRKKIVYVDGKAVEIVLGIDALTDAELADALHEGTLNAPLAVPVVFHDPAGEQFVLVVPPALAHRELDERIALLQQLAADPAPAPAYVKDFTVVVGHVAFARIVEMQAAAATTAREAEQRQELRQAQLTVREVEIDRRSRDLEKTRAELEIARADLEKNRVELEKNRVELEKSRAEARARVIAAAQQPPEEKTTVANPAQLRQDHLETRPVPMSSVTLPADVDHDVGDGDIVTSARASLSGAIPIPGEDFEAVATGISELPSRAEGVEMDEETTDAAAIPQGSDPLTTETHVKVTEGAPDAWLAEAMRETASSMLVQGNRVRLALVANAELARHLGGNLDARVLLYRTPDAPVVALVLGSPSALRIPNLAQLVVLTLDVSDEADRRVLATLAKSFVLDVEVIVRGPATPRRLRRIELTAPLGDNVGYILRAADDHLRGVSADGTPSFERACDRVLSPTFDLLGTQHSDTAEFRDDKLAGLETASSLRRAIAMARRFARPSREDYLVCTRGFPLVRWRELRRHVLESAVTWGLWMGPELAQVAVSEGLARSRRDLVVRLEQGFESLQRHPVAFDLDEEAAADNAKALAEEAKNLGVELKKPSAPVNASAAHGNGQHGKANGIATSESAPVASGSIHVPTPPGGHPVVVVARTSTGTKPPATAAAPAPAVTILNTPKAIRATDQLIGMLDSKEHRVGAALELCDRQVAVAAPQIIAAALKMSRADAVRVLGMCVKLGEAAKGPLVDGLGSNKGYLRHGCALALAMLRTEDGTQAVIDLLLTEPTEIWREVARAVGQVGPTALMPLASNYGRLGERATPAAAERVAWAMAHVGVRGGKMAIETMGNGQSIVAPVAKKALELIGMAAQDHVRVRPPADGQSQPGRDVTVNRAFSRRFFEALEQGNPEEAQAALAQLDASSPMEMLDESDLIEDAEDEAEQLDESDLIQP